MIAGFLQVVFGVWLLMFCVRMATKSPVVTCNQNLEQKYMNLEEEIKRIEQRMDERDAAYEKEIERILAEAPDEAQIAYLDRAYANEIRSTDANNDNESDGA